MQMVEQVRDQEVVASILKAEFNSSRFGDKVQTALANLVLKPNLENEEENRLRERVLSYRGFRERKYLFEGFPREVEWNEVILEMEDLEHLYYGNHEDWIELSEGSRLVRVGARHFLRSTAMREKFKVIAELFPAILWEPRVPIVLCQDSNRLIIIEGHARATAYMMAFPTTGVPAYIAKSPDMEAWVWL